MEKKRLVGLGKMNELAAKESKGLAGAWKGREQV
jgi:hypothetical protein